MPSEAGPAHTATLPSMRMTRTQALLAVGRRIAKRLGPLATGSPPAPLLARQGASQSPGPRPLGGEQLDLFRNHPAS